MTSPATRVRPCATGRASARPRRRPPTRATCAPLVGGGCGWCEVGGVRCSCGCGCKMGLHVAGHVDGHHVTPRDPM
eukprot:209796-Prymnesium_polylepis.1